MCTRIRKGIINPNYPGFQSLAYTLNEDNFDYSSENPSDDDEEDSYVSESDDNEMKRHQHVTEPPAGDENGNSYGDDDGGQVHDEELQLHSTVGCLPVVAGKLSSSGQYHHAVLTALESEESYPCSPVRRSRMRVIPTGCHSPSLTSTTAICGMDDKLASTGIYASTPPDIVLQHSFERRPSVLSAGHEHSKASLELTNSQRPDLIPEQQLQERRLAEREHDEQGRFGNGNSPVRITVADVPENDVIADEDVENENIVEGEDVGGDDGDDTEGNRTPPSPAVELVNGSNSNSDSSNNFLPDDLLSTDLLLDGTTRCYGEATDETLSDDSDQESDEGEFGYKPYGALQTSEETDDTPGNDDSGDSAGSSPGELQYHLVDDCSNQTVQITRSRQSNEHAVSHYYHLLQQYSSPRPVDFHNNQIPRTGGGAMEREINHNHHRHYPQESNAQMEPSDGECPNRSRPGRIAAQDDVVSTEYPDVRPSTVSFSRRDANYSTCTSRSEEGKQIVEELPRVNVDTSSAVRQPKKVAKVNPFCEMLEQEIDTCDFFTKQAKLQIEARMALCQAKDMAHMQMEIEKRSLLLSPVTKVIHTAVEKAGLSLASDKRRLSRYYLTRLNVHQLQTILTELQGHAEVLNEELVDLLMDRDELHISQDATLIDIEDLSRYLCAKEQTIIHAERQRKSYHWNNSRVAHHQPHQKQSSLPQPPLRSACGTVIPAYRYH